MRLDLVCVGNALIDAFASTADEGLASGAGMIAGSAVHLDRRRLGELLDALPGLEAVSGGGAANVAKLAALLGVSTAFQGAVGSDSSGAPDDLGRRFEEELLAAGVVLRTVRSRKPTGACLVLRGPGGGISVAAAPSAALDFGKKDLDLQTLGSARFVVFDGFALPRRDLADAVLERCAAGGVPLAVDLGATGIAAAEGLRLLNLTVAHPIILFMNENEAAALDRALGGPGSADGARGGTAALGNAGAIPRHSSPGLVPATRKLPTFPAILERSRPIGAPIFVVKLAERGAAAYAGGRVISVSTETIVPLDDTGAGDAFLAGFLAARLRDLPLERCLVWGNRTARELLGVFGSAADPAALAGLRAEIEAEARAADVPV